MAESIQGNSDASFSQTLSHATVDTGASTVSVTASVLAYNAISGAVKGKWGGPLGVVAGAGISVAWYVADTQLGITDGVKDVVTPHVDNALNNVAHFQRGDVIMNRIRNDSFPRTFGIRPFR
jgi:hypothetical protein